MPFLIIIFLTNFFACFCESCTRRGCKGGGGPLSLAKFLLTTVHPNSYDGSANRSKVSTYRGGRQTSATHSTKGYKTMPHLTLLKLTLAFGYPNHPRSSNIGTPNTQSLVTCSKAPNPGLYSIPSLCHNEHISSHSRPFPGFSPPVSIDISVVLLMPHVPPILQANLNTFGPLSHRDSYVVYTRPPGAHTSKKASIVYIFRTEPGASEYDVRIPVHCPSRSWQWGGLS